MRKLEAENVQLRCTVVDLTMDKQILREVHERNLWALSRSSPTCRIRSNAGVARSVGHMSRLGFRIPFSAMRKRESQKARHGFILPYLGWRHPRYGYRRTAALPQAVGWHVTHGTGGYFHRIQLK